MQIDGQVAKHLLQEVIVFQVFCPHFFLHWVISRLLSYARSLMRLSSRWFGGQDYDKPYFHSRRPLPLSCCHTQKLLRFYYHLSFSPSPPSSLFFFIIFMIPAKRFAEPICSNRHGSAQREGLCCPVGYSFKGGSGVEKLHLPPTATNF